MVDVLIVGSGLSGLTAAAHLKEHGHRVQIIDKGRNPGGRLASREAGGFMFNHGCGSLDLESKQLEALSLKSGLHLKPGYYGERGAINLIAKQLSQNLDLTQSMQAEGLSYENKQWLVTCHDFAKDQQVNLQAKVLLLTLPAPQISVLLTGVPDLGSRYKEESYDPQLVVMLSCPADAPLAELASYGRLEKGAIQNGVLSCMLRVSPEQTAKEMQPSLAELSDTWSKRVQNIGQLVSIHRWKYANCQNPQPNSFEKHGKLPLYIAGDSFGEKKLSGLSRAYSSGLAAGQAINQALR